MNAGVDLLYFLLVSINCNWSVFSPNNCLLLVTLKKKGCIGGIIIFSGVAFYAGQV